jgi:chromosome segregation protein
MDTEVRKEEGELSGTADRFDGAIKAVDCVEKALAEEKQRFEKLEISAFKLGLSEENLSRRAGEEYQKTLDDCAHLSESEERDEETLRKEAGELRERIARIGSVNELAIEECKEVEDRFNFMAKERDDLEGAKRRLQKTIAEINRTTRTRFETTFEEIRKNFQALYRRIFGGGRADLVMLTGEGIDPNEAGVEIVVQPPGKNLQSVELLSGGEKAMTAITLLFAIYQTKPSPFCILDEIDAPLDDTNVGRFCNLVRDFTDRTQFVIITHNKVTMEMSDVIYGVTMEEKGVSKIVSIQFDHSGRPNVDRSTQVEDSSIAIPIASSKEAEQQIEAPV